MAREKKKPQTPTAHALRVLRLEANLTQHQIAERVGVDSSIVSLWELGQRPIPKARLAKVAAVFGLTESDLVARVKWHRTMPAHPVRPPRGRKPPAWWELEKREARKREKIWLAQDTALQVEADRFRMQAGQPRYRPSYEALSMGPSPRCRCGRWHCREHGQGAA